MAALRLPLISSRSGAPVRLRLPPSNSDRVLQAIVVDAGEGFDPLALAVVDVAGGADDHAFVVRWW